MLAENQGNTRGGSSAQPAEAGCKRGEASHDGGKGSGRSLLGMAPAEQRETASQGGMASHASGHGHE